MIFMNINLVAVIVSAVAASILDYIWYSPWFLGSTWAAFMGTSLEALSNTTNLAWTFLGALLIAAALAYLLKHSTTMGLSGALQIAFCVWIVIAATLYVDALWTGKSISATHIDAAFRFVSLMFMAGILQQWGR